MGEKRLIAIAGKGIKPQGKPPHPTPSPPNRNTIGIPNLDGADEFKDLLKQCLPEVLGELIRSNAGGLTSLLARETELY